MLCASVATAIAQDRVALLIGNAAYSRTPQLTNPPNDVAEMAALLEEFGFDVTAQSDLSRDGMLDALGAFRRKAMAAEIALIFYSGHGFEIGADRST